MQLEVGKRYRRHNGQISGPLRLIPQSSKLVYPFEDDYSSYSRDGAAAIDSALDLVEEYKEQQPDPIRPQHYKQHPSGIECIDIAEHFNFCIGNTIKYLWRCHHKHENPIEDLKKARWYLDREIERATKNSNL